MLDGCVIYWLSCSTFSLWFQNHNSKKDKFLVLQRGWRICQLTNVNWLGSDLMGSYGCLHRNMGEWRKNHLKAPIWGCRRELVWWRSLNARSNTHAATHRYQAAEKQMEKCVQFRQSTKRRFLQMKMGRAFCANAGRPLERSGSAPFMDRYSNEFSGAFNFRFCNQHWGSSSQLRVGSTLPRWKWKTVTSCNTQSLGGSNIDMKCNVRVLYLQYICHLSHNNIAHPQTLELKSVIKKTSYCFSNFHPLGKLCSSLCSISAVTELHLIMKLYQNFLRQMWSSVELGKSIYSLALRRRVLAAGTQHLKDSAASLLPATIN